MDLQRGHLSSSRLCAGLRNKVSTSLKVFCEGTAAALKTLPQLDCNAFSCTANLIIIFVQLWKILNVHSSGLNDRRVDP